LTIDIQSLCLLPGIYSSTLMFTANGALDPSQAVNVSVVVQPHCGLITSTGFLAFTVVAGQSTLANQSLSLNATSSCAGTPTTWSSSSTASWLSVSPGSGQLKGTTSSVVTTSVNAAGLAASTRPYYADLSFVFGHSTLTVMAQVTVQAVPPSSSAPIMSASPLSLNFSNIQGQPSPTGQVVTITNNGHSALTWHSMANPLASSWLAAAPSGGTIVQGQSGQVQVNINTVVSGAPLTPGNYVGQITLVGMDTRGNIAPGSPQTIIVNLVVQPPCTISPPSASALSFNVVQGAPAPAAQTVLFTATGSCVWPVTWTTSLATRARWLTQAPSSGSIGGPGQSGSVAVGASIAGLAAKTYSTTITIAATDSSGAAVTGSGETFTVTLSILPPCVLSPPAPATLAFTLAQGKTSLSAQTVALRESGTCARPVAWQASSSSAWLVLSATSGTDAGAGSSFGVTAAVPASMAPGTYTGSILLTATDSTGASISGSGQTVSVTLTVTATLSGSVVACPGSIPPTCTAPVALAGATVTLMSGSTTVATTTADASGNYSFSGIPLGSYLLTVTGTDASNTSYAGSLSLTLTGDASNISIQAFPA
jgi:hypothetical protein